MTTYTIELKNVKYLGQMYNAIKIGLDLPDYFGENLDAMWDCLKSDIYFPAIIIIRGYSLVPNEIKTEMDKIIQLFAEAEQREQELGFEGSFDVQIVD